MPPVTPPVSASQGGGGQVDLAAVIPISLTVLQINQLLGMLGTQPYNQAADLIGTIRTQGDAYIVANGLLKPSPGESARQPRGKKR